MHFRNVTNDVEHFLFHFSDTFLHWLGLRLS